MSFLQRLSWLIFAACLLASSAFAAMAETEPGPARLVADLMPGSDAFPGSISGFLRVGSRSVFLRGDHEHRPALWVTDGTAEGTGLLAVLCPPCWSAEPIGSTGSVAFYRVSIASDPVYETAIWRSDGTPAGTFPLTESLPIYPDSPPGGPPVASLRNGLLFFTACRPATGCELWTSDGSPAGTALLGEIVPGPASAAIHQLAAFGDRAFLIVEAPGQPLALWIADGRTRTLRRLRETPEAKRLAVDAGRAFFLARDLGNGSWEVWASDGTGAGTRPVTSFRPQDPFAQTDRNLFLTVLGGRAWFMADDGAHGFELWSAGTQPASVRRVSNLRDSHAWFWDIAKAGDRVVFVATQWPGGTTLWSSRGELGSTARLAGCPGGCPKPISPLAPLGPGRLVFFGQDAKGGGFWITDGTGAGTRLLQRTARHELAQAVPLDGRVLFEVTDEYETGELWVTDGTAAGTFFAVHGGPNWSHYYGWGSSLQAGTAAGRLVFPARPVDRLIEELWRSDGSAAGSGPVTRSAIGRSAPLDRMTPLLDGLLVQSCFSTDEGQRVEMRFLRDTETTLLFAQESQFCFSAEAVDLEDTAVFLKSVDLVSVWRTDGTPEGTRVLIPESDGVLPAALARLGDEAALWMVNGIAAPYRSELWLTDGTPAGTRKQLDLPAGTEMYGLTAAGGRLWFFDSVGSGAESAWQPWVSDGTPAGTHPVTETVGYTLDPSLFVEAGGRVWFLFAEVGQPIEIWGSDGTLAGTGPAVTPASGAVAPEKLTAAGGRLYFAARGTSDPDGRLRPWVSDGTDGSTELLADVIIGDPTFAPLDRAPFVELDGRVWFAARDPLHGDELWSTDGTPEGTARLLDIAPGLLGAYPRGLTVWEDRLWFRARDAAHGQELWTSDGTAEGTHLVQDILPGPAWSAPGARLWEESGELTPTGSGLYFSAHDVEHGRELWVVPAGEP